jgi:hypothetical protein
MELGNSTATGLKPAWMDIGFNVISWSSDFAVYRDALRGAVDAVRDGKL